MARPIKIPYLLFTGLATKPGAALEELEVWVPLPVAVDEDVTFETDEAETAAFCTKLAEVTDETLELEPAAELEVATLEAATTAF